MTVEALLELKRERESDATFVRSNWHKFADWRKSLSQKEVAEALGIHQNYVSKFESGDLNGIGVEVVGKLVDLYKKLKEMSDGQ